MAGRLRRRSLSGRLLLHMLPVMALALLLQWLLADWLQDDGLALLLSLIALLPLLLWAVRRAIRPQLSLFRSLAGTVNSYRDADYSFGINWPSDDELAPARVEASRARDRDSGADVVVMGMTSRRPLEQKMCQCPKRARIASFGACVVTTTAS